MQFPLELPWSTVLAGLSNIACLYLGYLFARWRTRRRWKAVVHHAQHAWKDWTDEDIDQELHAYRALDPKKMFDDDAPVKTRPFETYRTAKETFVDIGGYIVILHPADVLRVERMAGSVGKPTGKPSSLYEHAAELERVAPDPEKLFEALSGQSPGENLNYTIAVRCLTCKQPAPLEVHPIQGVTAFELVQPAGWRLIFENRRARAAFSLQCVGCRTDILHEPEPHG